MLLSEVYKDFIDYLNPGNAPWTERGLVKDAPESAKKSYAEFLKLEKENEEQGIIT